MAKKYAINRKYVYNGKAYYIHADTEKDAAVKWALKLRDLEEGNITIDGDMLVKNWTRKCIDIYKTGQKEITRRAYENRVNHCILTHIGDMKMKDVKPIHCQNILNMLSGKSKAHISEVHSALKFIFGKAVTNGLIRVSPAEDLVRPQGTKNVRRSITEQEREHIIKVASGTRKYYVFLLMLFCGCRPSEARECMGKDIMQIDGYHMLHIRGTKTAAADRFVPIPDELYSIIKNTPKDEYIAVMRNGNRLNYEHRSRLWNSFIRELNLSMGCRTYRNQLIPPYPVSPDLVPYCLRHTYCTDLARMGIDIRIAQKLMGHTDIAMTANIYTNFTNDDIIAAAKAMEKQKGCNSGCNSKEV